MLTASAETIAQVTTGSLLAGTGETMGNGVVIDSRKSEPGSVFVALRGERVDGHDFIVDAVERGARIVLVSEEQPWAVLDLIEGRGGTLVRVEDGLRALQDLAQWHRSRLHATVIGVTGSTGKTTTKDFLTAVLRVSHRVVSTQGNQNNEIGVPLTIVSAGSDTDVLVVEMGMRGLGQIARLAEISQPDVALVTNVGSSHIELLGTQEAVAVAKGELVEAVQDTGAVFLNGDDAFSETLADRAHAPVTLYGLCERCVVRAEDVTLDDASRARFTLATDRGNAVVTLPIPGRHNVYNALAAAAVGLHVGVSAEKVAEALGSARVSDMRMQTFETASGVTVVSDAYNASPSSMRAAVETLAEMRAQGRRVAVLGDMAELGSLSELAHFRIGEAVARLPIDVLVTIGDRARRIADGAKAEGMHPFDVHAYATPEEANDALEDVLGPGDVVLVKASRVMGLERVVERIVTPSAG